MRQNATNSLAMITRQPKSDLDGHLSLILTMPIYTHFKAVWASASVLKFGGLNPGVENGPVVKATYNVVLPLTSLLRRPPLYEVTHFFTLVTNRFIIISGLRSDHDKEELILVGNFSR
jgi:hypothetical protein